MSKISENVLGNIKKNGVRPTCRLYFVAREILFWMIYITIIFLGAFVFAGILELLFGGKLQWPSLEIILQKIFNEVPYYWFFTLIFFLFGGLYVNRRTKKSYRFKKRIILIGEILVVFLLGTVLYFLEAGALTCQMLGK